MNETEFITLANATLENIASAIDAADLDCECVFKGDGILEVEFDDDSKMIINRNSSIQEIWLAAPSGGFHFRHKDGQWLDTRDGCELLSRVAQVIRTATGRDVALSRD